ncbi:MAG: glucose-6-phosphate isomerase [Lysobacterales bacterium]|jgi:glucose-6-phosphate isomerase
MDQKFLHLLQKYNISSGSIPLARRVADPDRFRKFSIADDGLLLDFSRTGIRERELAALHGEILRGGLAAERDRLFSAANVNFTEQRPALHMALRSDEVLDSLDGDSRARALESRRAMSRIAAALAGGHLPGATGERVRHIVHLGIGGSMLGPRLLIEALPSADSPQVHFISSIDAHSREALLGSLDPAATAVVVATKSFTTGETLLHARRLLDWLRARLGKAKALERLFAVTGNVEAAAGFGVAPANTLYLPDWVGGRYSVWSAVSLAASAVIGKDGFDEFLRGGAEMDRHFRQAAPAGNLPVTKALVDIWHRHACAYPVQAVIPYDYRLRSLPAYLQQLIMESNGKSVDRAGKRVEYPTAPVIFGEVGTDAQHSLFQMFHQGTDIVPLTFIGALRPAHTDAEAHAGLLANMLAQATALATGTMGSEPTDAHRRMPGGRPSDIILLDELTPRNLGRLLAMYEHKVFVESVLWDINAFDQFGVELGKRLARAIQPALEDSSQSVPEDYGLNSLLTYIRDRR